MIHNIFQTKVNYSLISCLLCFFLKLYFSVIKYSLNPRLPSRQFEIKPCISNSLFENEMYSIILSFKIIFEIITAQPIVFDILNAQYTLLQYIIL